MLTLEFLQFLQDSRTTEYFFVISMTVLVYDHVINFHQEVELIWKKRITCGGATYLLIRYLGLATVIFDANFLLREVTDDKMWVFLILESDQFKLFWNSCQKSLRVENALSSIVLMLADIVLDFRIWILYGKKRTVLLGLLFLTASQWVVTNTLVILDVDKQSEYLHLGPSLKGCYSKSATEADPLLIFAQYYITPIAANAIIMFVLSSYKCGQALWNNGWYRMPVMSLFLRDGFLWFFATFSAYVLCRESVDP
ncbi:hypothetical protein BDQ12DRAFT_725750 [Crucibulum laeve]|uniref:DUF6533 domain-containing protein n=1 Tax=Crucibulum laeve TaxID=68775 RepID=A0A5C3LSE1_9AGAR|nr:hypothetical protein BDQ12DRAFT_725750 [Crucibulum laeve]